MSRDLAARELVGEQDFHVGRHAQAEHFGIGLREEPAGLLILDDGGFECRPGELVLDPRDGMPEIEQSGRRFPLLQKAQQAAAKESGSGEIGIAFFGPENKNGGSVWKGFESGVKLREVGGDIDRGHQRYSRRYCSRGAGGTRATPMLSRTCSRLP